MLLQMARFSSFLNLNNIPMFLCVCVERERKEKERRDERKERRGKEKKKERIFSLSIHSQAFFGVSNLNFSRRYAAEMTLQKK